MSDVPQGPGWWQASDQKWYPPEAFPGAPQPSPAGPPPGAPPGTPPGAPGGMPQGWGTPVGGTPPRTDPMAIWALVLGIVGIPLGCLCGIGIFASIAAIPLGFVSRKNIRQSSGGLTGEGMALAGAVLGIVGVALLIGLFLLWGLSAASLDSSGRY